MAKLIYGTTEINLTEGTTPQVALETLKSVYPELANASLSTNAAGDHVVTVATATKGAYAVYGETKVELKPGVTPEAVKNTLSAIYPEIENATTSVNAAGDIVFTVATATKGAYAVYGETKVELKPGVTPEAVKNTLSAIYPEIENATTSVNAAGDIVFTVATATKGN